MFQFQHLRILSGLQRWRYLGSLSSMSYLTVPSCESLSLFISLVSSGSGLPRGSRLTAFSNSGADERAELFEYNSSGLGVSRPVIGLEHGANDTAQQ